MGMEEGVFPHSRSLMEEDEMEEERRLAYVGITRAEEELFLTNAQMRTLYGQTKMNPVSRFIKEIPEDLLDDVHDREEKCIFFLWKINRQRSFTSLLQESRSHVLSKPHGWRISCLAGRR